MADEAEKLYNISLCKIAESRSIRRGGTSLHKHLLISTVLTKTRSAIFDTWYMGDGEVSYNREEDGSVGSINLNASFQESDFPLEDSEDDDGLLDSGSSSTSMQQVLTSSSTNHVDSSTMCDSSSSLSNNDEIASHSGDNNHMIDPRFFVEVESEIELPSDILNCVEKLGDISEHMNFTVTAAPADHTGGNHSASSPSYLVSSLPNSVSISPVPLEPVMAQNVREANSNSGSVVIVDTHNNDGISELTYLDLDSSSQSALTDFCDSENNNNNPHENIFGHPLNCSTPNPSKRRRGWSLEEEEEDSGNEEDNEDSNNLMLTPPQKSVSNCTDTSPRSGLTSMTNLAKRLRFSPECEGKESEGRICSNNDQNSSVKVSNPSSGLRIIDSKFRTKKSHFEEDEQEEPSEDDPFLGDALGQGPLDGDYTNGSESRDRRVPSASSSSGSSSDEDESNSMEVDQITNLVQFFSFSKSHHNQSSSPSSHSSGSSNNSNNGLVRSMSSPDLCGLSAASRASSPGSSISSSSKSANNAKDLFSFVSSANTSHISRHRVLTMTV